MRAAAHEQRVLQKVAQSLQSLADRGLGEVQLLAGASDVALAVNDLHHHEQVQVELTQMHAAYNYKIRKIHLENSAEIVRLGCLPGGRHQWTFLRHQEPTRQIPEAHNQQNGRSPPLFVPVDLCPLIHE